MSTESTSKHISSCSGGLAVFEVFWYPPRQGRSIHINYISMHSKLHEKTNRLISHFMVSSSFIQAKKLREQQSHTSASLQNKKAEVVKHCTSHWHQITSYAPTYFTTVERTVHTHTRSHMRLLQYTVYLQNLHHISSHKYACAKYTHMNMTLHFTWLPLLCVVSYPKSSHSHWLFSQRFHIWTMPASSLCLPGRMRSISQLNKQHLYSIDIVLAVGLRFCRLSQGWPPARHASCSKPTSS